jgi:hypothetical protein
MRILLGLGAGLSLAVSLAVGCNGPASTDGACTSVGGVCQSDTLECTNDLPQPCASPSNVCCVPLPPGQTPSPTGTDGGAGSGNPTPDAGAGGQ